ncbi:hypothetical protein MASR2M15_25670 [Anaerolineales bacterium]
MGSFLLKFLCLLMLIIGLGACQTVATPIPFVAEVTEEASPNPEVTISPTVPTDTYAIEASMSHLIPLAAHSEPVPLSVPVEASINTTKSDIALRLGEYDAWFISPLKLTISMVIHDVESAEIKDQIAGYIQWIMPIYPNSEVLIPTKSQVSRDRENMANRGRADGISLSMASNFESLDQTLQDSLLKSNIFAYPIPWERGEDSPNLLFIAWVDSEQKEMWQNELEGEWFDIYQIPISYKSNPFANIEYNEDGLPIIVTEAAPD